MDEKRIQARRKDWLLCCKVKEDSEGDDDHADPNASLVVTSTESQSESTDSEAKHSIDGEDANEEHIHLSGLIMERFACIILIPWMKALILLIFAATLGVGIWSTTLFKLAFDFRSVLPSNSYVVGFYKAANSFTNRQGPSPFIYFRFVDQSDPEIQAQMISYVEDIVNIDSISDPPFRFWLVDYQEYVANNPTDTEDLPFIDRLLQFLEESDYDFWGDMMFDKTGTKLVASRTQVNMDNVDPIMLDTGIAALEEQRAVSRAQPINQGSDEFAFFTYDEIYLLWEFLLITPYELTKTTLIGLGSVSFISILFMPHWSGILFVAPMVMILYVELMGFVPFFGVTVNAVTYVCLLVAIGLLVDFVMHVVLRYYESGETKSRDARVIEVLRTMGASVMLGGVSTFLGVVPLMFSTSELIVTCVITFTGVVILGKYYVSVFVACSVD